MALSGSYVALSKPLVAALPVFLLAWLRFGIGALAMMGWMRKPHSETPMNRTTRQLLFLESFLGNFLFSICMLYGVSMTTALAAGMIMASIPAVVALMSWLFLGEHVSPRVWLAVACAVSGIALLSIVKPDGVGSPPQTQALLGNLLVFCAVLCEGAYAVIGKKLTGSLGPKRISALINLWGFALMTPLGLYLAFDFDFKSVPGHIWPLLIFYALAASVWTVWLWMTGMRRIPANQGGIFTVMLPITAAAVGVLFLGERLSVVHLVAFAITMTGVLLVTLPARRPS